MNRYFFNIIFVICLPFSLTGEPALIIPYDGNVPLGKSCYIAISCVFQNEAVWLKEWIEYHRLVGVEHFYLYNNLSQDNYLSVLKPYIANGIVDLYDYPEETFGCTQQTFIYNHALTLAKKNQHQWLAIIDADEFITPLTGTSLNKILPQYESAPGIYVKWVMFGTSDVNQLGKKDLLIEKLVYRSHSKHIANRWGKSIVQPNLTERCLNPHVCSYADGNKMTHMPRNELRINHYYFRTEDYLYQIKIPRLEKRKVIHSNNAFSASTILQFKPLANVVHDHSMEPFVKPLKKRVFSSKIAK